MTNLFLKPARGSPMAPASEIRAVEGYGLEGDIAFGSERRQVLLVDSGVLANFGLVPGSIRENITVEGLPFDDLTPGTLLEIGEAAFHITCDCVPCEFLDAVQPGLRARMEGQRGVLATVVSSGWIRIGDHARVVPSKPASSGG